MSSIEILTIGNLTEDKIFSEGKNYSSIGGPSFYASRVCNKLGIKVGVVSASSDNFQIRKFLVDAVLFPQDRKMHTVFYNNYENGLRTQKVVSYPENLNLREFHYPHIWEPPKLIFYCPVLNEIDYDFLDIFENSIKVCSLQGWMRVLDKDGNVSIRKDLPGIKFSKFDVVVLSEFDATLDQALEISNFSLVCLTQGEKGSSLIKKGNVKNFDTLSANCIDSTGAGDVWAITFSIFHFILNNQINDSAKFANLAATFSVEGLGDSRIPSMEKLLNNRTW